MAKVVWSRLPQRLELLVREGEVVERPSTEELDATLDDYEARAGFRLPLAYREFVHWFGPGALSSWFKIAAPIQLDTAGVWQTCMTSIRSGR